VAESNQPQGQGWIRKMMAAMQIIMMVDDGV
jgi:hypothetical protein